MDRSNNYSLLLVGEYKYMSQHGMVCHVDRYNVWMVFLLMIYSQSNTKYFYKNIDYYHINLKALFVDFFIKKYALKSYIYVQDIFK